MGWGSYTSADWAKLRTSVKMDEGSSYQSIFKRNSIDPRFDPRYIGIREARDSEDHPESTPIILGFDVTGSMGYLAEQIAKESLHETMMKLFSTKPVTDPQIMFAAIGDCGDDAPLQVTQFESDIRIAEQLLDLWLEGRGGDYPEDYQLLWYFAAKHTSVDSFEKRGKKGYIFTIGDADCHTGLSAESIEKVFCDKSRSIMSSEAAHDASEKYELFHIHIFKGLGNYRPDCMDKILPGRVIAAEKAELSALPEIIVSAMLLCEGRPLEEVLANWSADARPIVKKAVSGLVLKNKNGVRF